MSFEKFNCFKLSDINQIADRYAEHEKSDALFLTTHAKSTIRSEINNQIMDDDDLLEQFMRPLSGPNDYRNFVIKGNTGSGKSHLVKWLHTKQTDDKNLWPVYIDKANTHLRAVIEKSIEGFDGAAFKGIRKELNRTQKFHSSIDEAKVNLLSSLADNVEFADRNSQPTEDGELKAREWLPNLLRDPGLKEQFLKEDGVIHYACQLELEDNKEDVDEKRQKFREEDLKVITHENFSELEGKVSQPSREYLNLLRANAGLMRDALDVLEIELARAKRRIFIGDSITLGEVFRKVRFELKKKNKELVFYVEEFVRTQGIDKELADALITNEDGLCGVRAVIAVTGGFWEQNFSGTTFATRSTQFSLDLEDSQRPEEKSSHYSCTYVAGYLNALRLGINKIEEQKENIKNPDWQPENACLACEHRDICHAAFGKTEDDIGFYPYNENAIINISQVANEKNGPNKEIFNPRANLLYLIGDSRDGDQVKGLRVAIEELPEGKFPSENFANGISDLANRANVDVVLRNELADNPRRLSLLNFWIKDPADNRPLRENLDADPRIHTAFGLPKIGKGSAGGGDSKPEPLDPPEPPVRGASVSKAKREEFDLWAQKASVLPAAIHRDIRHWVHSEIVEVIQNGPYGLWVGGTASDATIGALSSFHRDKHILIENSEGGPTNGEGVRIKIRCGNAEAVLLWETYFFITNKQWRSVESHMRVKNYINDRVKEIVKEATFSNRKKDYLPYLELLAVTSQAKLKDPDEDLMVGVINGFSNLDAGDGNRDWTRWVTKAGVLRTNALDELQSRFGGSKRAATASFLDIAAVLPDLEKCRNYKSLKPTPDDFKYHTDFSDLIKYQEEAFNKTWEKVHKSLEKIGDDVLEVSDVTELRSHIEPVISLAKEAGIGKGDSDGLLRDALQLEDSYLENAKKLKGLTDPGVDNIWELVPDPADGLYKLQTYLDKVQDAFEHIQSKLDEQTSGEEENSLNQLLVEFESFDSNIDAINEMFEDGDLW